LAYKAQTTAAQISRIENDERPGVQAVTIGRIALALDTTVEYLMGQTGDSGRPPPRSESHEDAMVRARVEELIRRWRLVAQYAPEQLDKLVNLAYTNAELVLGMAGAGEETEETREEVDREQE
jgi:transcriptional regulator with XRE-family HTH domain